MTSITISGATSVKKGDTITLSAEIAPAEATDKSLYWYSNDTSIASVAQNGVVTGVSKGSVTIAARSSSGNAEGSIEITVIEEIEEKDATVLDLIKLTTRSSSIIYNVTAYIGGYDDPSKDKAIGKYEIYDAEGHSIYITGSTASESAFKYEETDGIKTSVSFTNPKDFLTNDVTKDATIGSKVVLKVVCPPSGGRFALVTSVTLNAAAADLHSLKPSAYIKNSENGTYSFSKETLTYGESFTITFAPNEGYTVKNYAVTFNARTTTPDVPNGYVYTLTAFFENEVIATFIEDEKSTILTSSALGIPVKTSVNTFSSASGIAGNVEWESSLVRNMGLGIEMEHMEGVADDPSDDLISEIHNNYPLRHAVASVEFGFVFTSDSETMSGSSVATESNMDIAFSSDGLTYTKNASLFTDDHSMDYTVNVTSTLPYIKFIYNNLSCALDTITINYVM